MLQFLFSYNESGRWLPFLADGDDDDDDDDDDVLGFAPLTIRRTWRADENVNGDDGDHHDDDNLHAVRLRFAPTYLS